jgi:hypothetical protein
LYSISPPEHLDIKGRQTFQRAIERKRGELIKEIKQSNSENDLQCMLDNEEMDDGEKSFIQAIVFFSI